MNIEIRLEKPSEHRLVENIIREAFWNIYAPGCDEHYLAHILRTHPDFIGELNLVAVADGAVIGNIMYTRSYVIDSEGKKHGTITFGPLAILPEYQGKGIGELLICTSLEKAVDLGYTAAIIFGSPDYYSRHGFTPCKDYNISTPDEKFPAAHQIAVLRPERFQNIWGKFYDSDVFNFDPKAAEEFDKNFTPKEKIEGTESQKKFLREVAMFL